MKKRTSKRKTRTYRLNRLKQEHLVRIRFNLPEVKTKGQLIKKTEINEINSKLRYHLQVSGMTKKEAQAVLQKAGLTRKFKKAESYTKRLNSFIDQNRRELNFKRTKLNNTIWLYSKPKNFVKAANEAYREESFLRWFENPNSKYKDFDMNDPNTWDDDLIKSLKAVLIDYGALNAEDFKAAWDDPYYADWIDRILTQVKKTAPFFLEYNNYDICEWLYIWCCE